MNMVRADSQRLHALDRREYRLVAFETVKQLLEMSHRRWGWAGEDPNRELSGKEFPMCLAAAWQSTVCSRRPLDLECRG